ncbi:bifunctional oligoribonuclease/PAP phosphatase NrnA [Paenalkalicoccus suaedae]|uniref:Bifunctional oligoribonuclease/PAP phosphatase NrnA n=1 Tax=Paenalkalicoccus suaedae TaxID=2592382 RepID=A0A859FII2_9BACI|nr:bifunctional oligoribonuclease/PAP phosphatase NrnA [Paenalkalicoccus suaedae]QKS72045.1 bifunctional oligoribonuclease/PAP phosphatase NrnA [Paenalkalicoccus suaedae]
MTDVKKRIIEEIKQWDSIIILRHVRPDPDAIGSQAGLKELILTFFPDKKVYLGGETEPSLSFLSEMDEISEETFEQSLVIACDTANTERIDDERYQKASKLIKIDHHPEVDRYGDIQWVSTDASSTCEMITELYLELSNDTPENDLARLLYAGIVADTGRFKFSNTTEKTFRYASFLINASFSRDEIHEKLYEKKRNVMKLEGFVLSNVDVMPSGAAAIKLTKSVLENYQVTSKDSSAIVNCFSTLEGLKAWVFFVEEEDIIRVRLRSKEPIINTLAEQYNGGGHPMASGASVATWEEADELIKKLNQLCEDAS